VPLFFVGAMGEEAAQLIINAFVVSWFGKKTQP